jgi:hypothetical protein
LRAVHIPRDGGRRRVQVAVMPVESPGQGAAEVAQEVPAVRDRSATWTASGAPLRTPSA